MGDLTSVRQLDPAVVTVWRAIAASVAAPVVLVAAGVGAATGLAWVWLAAVVLLVVAAVAVGWLPAAAYDRFRWGIEDGIVRIQRGIVFRTEASVPAFRIQHIDLTQGPLDRWAGLQHLVVHTAAPAADLELPGIAASEAPRVRAQLLEAARDAATAPGADETVDAV